MKIEEIEISKIKENPYQTREEIKVEPLKVLAKSIRERGFFNPISVLKSNGDYIIINGHRKLGAFKLLKKKTIPSIIKLRKDGNELIVDLIHENLIREDLTPIEKGLSIKLLFSQIESTKNDVERMKTLINSLKNYQRRGYTPKFTREKTEGFKENDIFALDKILKSIGISPNNATTYLNLLKLPREIRIAVNLRKKGNIIDGKISVRKAEQLARIDDKEY